MSHSGAKIYTSISPTAQTNAEKSVAKIMAADTQYPDEAAALVAIDPTTGGILAYYGGDGSTSYDLAQTPEQPGSSCKPYVFAAALQTNPQTIGLNTIYDGSDNQVIAGQTVHNSDGEGAPQITVKDAMTQSVNTVFYQMAYQVGVENVRQAAWDAGIPKKITPALGKPFDSLQQVDANGKGTGVTELGISIGQYQVRPIDQAQGYATFANNGMYIPAHFVTRVTNDGGTQMYQASTVGTPAFSSDLNTNASIAHTVAESMTDVATSSGDGLADNRPNAAKTGTAQYQDSGHNSEAWMVGFTPQIVTAVWFGNKKQPAPIYGNYHNGIGSNKGYNVYGREEPGYIWQAFMNAYLTGKPVQQFPNIATIGPTTTPTPTPTTPSTPTAVTPSQPSEGFPFPIPTGRRHTTTPHEPTAPTTTCHGGRCRTTGVGGNPAG